MSISAKATARATATTLLALVASLAEAGCPGNDPVTMAGDGGTEAGAASWTTVAEKLDGALLAVWGPSAKDVWSVGGALGNGGPPLVVRWDGAKLATVPTTGTETYWWVHGSGASDVWMVGEKGRISHWNGTALEERPSGTTATLFGVMAFAPDDVWAVGGTPDQPDAPNDVLLHWDGASWKAEPVPEPRKVAFFKVWGARPDDLWVVGEAGVIWHRLSGAWKREGEGVAQGRLTTVAGCSASEVYAVGGRDVLAWNGAAWSKVDVQLLNDVNGVACAPPGAAIAAGQARVVIVGGGSLKLRRGEPAGTGWTSDFGQPPLKDLHGAFVDETGVLWGAGGSFASAARPGGKRDGVLARYATP